MKQSFDDSFIKNSELEKDMTTMIPRVPTTLGSSTQNLIPVSKTSPVLINTTPRMPLINTTNGTSPSIINIPRIPTSGALSTINQNLSEIPIPNSPKVGIVNSMNMGSGQIVSPINSKLTIYSRSGHIVQQYPQGTKLITLPKSVEVSSIVAIDGEGKIIPFSYIPETNMGIALTDRSTGEKVQAVVIKENQNINGKVLSLDSDNVMLMTGNQITNIREYDRITVNINEDLTRPRLVLDQVATKITLSYLLSSLAWTCVGTGLIDDINNIMYLRLAGNISNNTESDIQANTTLVSGEVYQYRNSQDVYAESDMMVPRATMMAVRAPAPMRSKQVQTAMLEDYVKYQVGNRLVRNRDIAELGTWSFPVIKLYVHQTNDNDKVQFGYRFTAPEYIPSCSLNVYSIDSQKNIDSYLGSNDIDESQKAEDIDIILGESTLLQCKSLVVVSNDIIVNDEATARKFNLPLETFSKGYKRRDERDWHIITEDLKVDITNYNTGPSQGSSLVLKHYVGNKYLVETRCQAYKDRKNGFIEWYFQVPFGTSSQPRKENFSCQIVTASYY